MAATETPGTATTAAVPEATRTADALQWDIESITEETPAYLVPKMDHEAVSTPVYYRQLVIHDPAPAAGTLREVDAAIDPFVPLTQLPAPAGALEGALLTYEQGWYEKGLALGRLLHSTCLAPGEVTKIAITSFQRQSTGRSDETAAQTDEVGSETDQASAVHETQRAVASESQAGASFNLSAADQSQLAVSGGGLFVSGSASTALSAAMGVTTASSSSASDIAADGARNLSQRTVATSHAVRGRRATQVREASEDEAQSAATRVIANYNHMHALTMMYFEVLQIYALQTRVVHAERVIFLPMQDIRFDQAFVARQQTLLKEVLAISGTAGIDEMFTDYLGANLTLLEQDLEGLIAMLRNALAEAGYRDNAKEARFAAPEFPGLDWILEQYRSTYDSFKAKVDAGSTSREDTGNLETARVFLDRVGGAFTRLKAHRARMRRLTRLLDRIEEQRGRVSTALWMLLDPAVVQRLVAGLTFKGEPLANLMDPRPLGVHGNYVAFRMPHAKADGDARFIEAYLAGNSRSAPAAKVVLPSGGVFGEAVLGQAVSAEKIDLTRFWNWKDSPIPILPPDISPISLASRAQGQSFDRVQMEGAITEILKPVMPAGVDLGGLVGKIMSNFKDMSGQDSLAKILAAQIGAAQSGAAKAGDQSIETLKANQAFGKALLDSDIVKAAVASALPEGEAATVLGGLIGATKSSGAKASAAAKPDKKKPVTPAKGGA